MIIIIKKHIHRIPQHFSWLDNGWTGAPAASRLQVLHSAGEGHPWWNLMGMEREWPIYSWFSHKKGDFPIKNGDLPIKHGDFPIKHGDFPIKNGDFTH